VHRWIGPELSNRATCNSVKHLALRVPAPFAREIGAFAGTTADMAVENGKLVVKVQGKKRRRYSLEELLEGITRENYYEEID
jgi:antitoxin MazE